MARSDTRFREAFNQMLGLCDSLPVGTMMPSESTLADSIGVSRTVIRRCLDRLEELNLIIREGRGRQLLRHSVESDRIDQLEQHSSSVDLEERFLTWVLQFDVPANTPLSVAELSRTFDVPQHELKEFLAGLSRFGLVARRRQGGWQLLGFTKDFAVELSDFRSVLEQNAVSLVADAPVDHPIWAKLAQLREDHLALKARIDTDFHQFSKLDERFHETINSYISNRFIAEFQKVISLIFHYHYMWDKTHEKMRNASAIDEHLLIIDALESRDAEAARAATIRHMRTSKITLLSSLRHHELG